MCRETVDIENRVEQLDCDVISNQFSRECDTTKNDELVTHFVRGSNSEGQFIYDITLPILTGFRAMYNNDGLPKLVQEDNGVTRA